MHSLERRAGAPPRLMQRIFGLLGPNGALPLHLTEYARERAQHHGDPTFQRFLDTLTHRFALLFYRAWAEAQPR
jgi:type VI secretion system protein ImpH